MDLCVFDIDDGYAQAIIRGFRASFLTEFHIDKRTMEFSISELKSFFDETDYQNCLQLTILRNQFQYYDKDQSRNYLMKFEYIEVQSTEILPNYLFLSGMKQKGSNRCLS